MKQTAVDFAVEQLEKLIPSGNQIIIRIILQKAKEMEKEQIMEAYRQGLQDYRKHYQGEVIRKEKYYNKTYRDK
jgi:hypothetical protein